MWLDRSDDIVAEWLRRWIANPLDYVRESSNLFDVDSFFSHLAKRNMVQVEQLLEEEPPRATHKATDKTAEESTDESPPSVDTDEGAFEGWTKLMGKDLLIRPIHEVPEATAVQPHDTVVIDFVGRLAESPAITNGPIFHQATDWIIVIGEKDVLPVLEMGVRFMQAGETAAVWSHAKFAYGTGQRQHHDQNTTGTTTTENDNHASSAYILPANSHVRYEVTVKRIWSEAERTSPSGQVQVARSKKMIGNDIYVNEWFGDYGPARAKQQYKRGAETMQYLLQSKEDIDKEILEEAREIMLDCLNNIAALHLRAKEYKLAKEAAIQVLTHDPDSFKALIRAAKAALLDPGSSYEEVDAAIKAAAERTDASDADVQRLRAEFRRRKQAYKEKSKAMFSKLGESSTRKKGDDGEAIKTAVAKDKSPTSTRDSVGKVEPKSWLNWREWDWKNKILPYGFQLILPFLTYSVFILARKRQAESSPEEEGVANEGANTEF